MPKEAVFTMKLEAELREEFMAEAEAMHRPASQILRELMREFVQRQRTTREYDEFLSTKVDAARASMRAGRGRSNDEVEARSAKRRASVDKQGVRVVWTPEAEQDRDEVWEYIAPIAWRRCADGRIVQQRCSRSWLIFQSWGVPARSPALVN